MNISIIAAIAQNHVIGKQNKLLWHIPADLKRFKQLTTNHHIIMGRKTFESIGRVLPNREHIVLTSQPNYATEHIRIATSLGAALQLVTSDDEVFIIGGASVYQAALEVANKMYITHVHQSYDGDAYFPSVEWKDWKIEKEEQFLSRDKNKCLASFVVYVKK